MRSLSLCGKYAWLAGLVCITGAYASVNVTLSATPNPSLSGQAVALGATVSPADQTGKVTFYDGSAILGTASIINGVANLTTTSLGAGLHPVYARFVDGTNEPSNPSNTVSQVVHAESGGSFVFSTAPSFPGLWFDTLTTGDINNDGHIDVIATTRYGTPRRETRSMYSSTAAPAPSRAHRTLHT